MNYTPDCNKTDFTLVLIASNILVATLTQGLVSVQGRNS